MAIGATSTVWPTVLTVPMVRVAVDVETAAVPTVSARADRAVGKSSAAPIAVRAAATARVRVVVRRMSPSSVGAVDTSPGLPRRVRLPHREGIVWLWYRLETPSVGVPRASLRVD